MNLRSVTIVLVFVASSPTLVQAQILNGLIYNLDRILEFLTFGLIDIREDDPIQEIDDRLPGGIVANGICNTLKNIAVNRLILPEAIVPAINELKCGCDVLRLGGEMKFGCDFEEPVCINVNDYFGFDDDFTFAPTISFFPTKSPFPTRSPYPTVATISPGPTAGTISPFPTRSPGPTAANPTRSPGPTAIKPTNPPGPTAPPAPTTESGVGRRHNRRTQDENGNFAFCLTANIRADYNGRSPLTPFAEETLTTRACAEILNATFFIPQNVTVPKVCAVVEHNEGLTNLISLKSCTLFAVRSDGTTDLCKKCEICGEGGLGVLFDCSNVNFDSSGKTNFTLPPFDEVCLSAGTIPLSRMNDADFVYRPFLTPMP